jgi:hypothetical protein
VLSQRPVVWSIKAALKWGGGFHSLMRFPKAFPSCCIPLSIHHQCFYPACTSFDRSFLAPLAPQPLAISNTTCSTRLLAILSQSSISLEDSNPQFLECREYSMLPLPPHENNHKPQDIIDQDPASTSNAAVAAAPTAGLAMTHQRPPQAHRAPQIHSLARRLGPEQSAENGHT